MRRTRRMFLAGLLSLLALAPVAALAATTTEYVAGVEYALGSCTGGSTGSFAGYGSLTARGAPNAVFNTTICHSGFDKSRTATIIAGGSFTLVMTSVTLVGLYTGGTVGPGVVHGSYLCTETFPVKAGLGLGNGPGKAVILSGSAVGHLTHYGVRNGAACNAYAATITGLATLSY